VKIQLVQMHPEINEKEPDLGKEANLNKISDYVDKGLEAGANLIAFGECALVGENLDKVKYRDLCEPIPGPATEKIANKLRGKSTYVVFGMAEADGSCVYNSAPLIGPQGVVGVCRKLYLVNFESVVNRLTWTESTAFKPGQRISIFDTEFGRVGIQICYDQVHTEISLAQALAGAWLIIHPQAFPIPIIMEGKVSDETKAAATIRSEVGPAENEVCWASVNLVGDQLGTPFNGGSLIVMGSKGVLKTASIAGEAKEEVLTAEVDPEEIYKARRRRWNLRDTRIEILEQLLEIGKKSI